MHKLLGALGIFLCASTAYADDLHLLSLDRFAVEGYQIRNNRNEYFPIPNAPTDQQEYWTSGYAAMFDVDFVKYKWFDAYYRARVHAETTNEQVRQVGLQFETGFEITNYVNVWWRHDSEHILDEYGFMGGRYPLENFIGLTATIYKRDR